jgi:hypothetical protein
MEKPPEWQEEYSADRCYFSTTKFGARIPDDEEWGDCEHDVCDCRHGRVLLDSDLFPNGPDQASLRLVVWDPMTGSRREMHTSEDHHCHAAAVLCSVTGCDHRACHEGPFLVVSVGMKRFTIGDKNYFAHTWSSETCEWSEPCYAPALDPSYYLVRQKPPVLIRDALYFMLCYPFHMDKFLKFLVYELGSSTLSVIDAPLAGPVRDASDFIHMAMEGGNLGFAHVNFLSLRLWSIQAASGAWTQHRVIYLQDLLPHQDPSETLNRLGLLWAVISSFWP